MTTAWINASVYTGERFVEALLTEGNRIKIAGGKEDVLQANPDRLVDLEGRFVMPGFNDSHLHILSFGKTLHELSLTKARSTEELIALSREYLTRHPDRCQRALIGRGWNQDLFDKKAFPTKEDLDRISRDLPIVLTRVCGHVALVNSKVLELLEIDEHTPHPPGGVIERVDGEPTGLFTETALDLLDIFHPQYTKEEIRSQLKDAFEHAIEAGLTSIQSNDLSAPDALDIWTILCEMDKNAEIPLRLTEQIHLESPEELEDFFAEAPIHPSDFLSLGPIKLFKDGSLGARTALLRQDYADAPAERGTDTLDDGAFERIITWAQEHGHSLITHVIGDGALEKTLDRYAKAKDPSRLGLVHCQISSSSQLDRIAKIGCFVLAQPIFLDYDLSILTQRVGAELASSSYAFGTLMRKGVSVSMGTDCPVEDLAPLPNLLCAITRTNLNGEPKGGFHPEHAFSLREAIHAYTLESAIQEGKGDIKGTLEPGHLADFIVLENDPFQKEESELLNNQVLMTVIGSEILYQDESLRKNSLAQ